MSTPPWKYILTATLIRFGPSLPPDLRRVLRTGSPPLPPPATESNIELDPSNPDDSLARLRGRLREKRWEGLLIGFAVRGSKEYTPMFDGVVNLVSRPRSEIVV